MAHTRLLLGHYLPPGHAASKFHFTAHPDATSIGNTVPLAIAVTVTCAL
jgi:hypothetical protein